MADEKTLKDSWEAYSKALRIKKEEDPAKWQSCRLAYFAGAVHTVSLMRQAMLSENGGADVQALLEELNAFVAEVEAWRA